MKAPVTNNLGSTLFIFLPITGERIMANRPNGAVTSPAHVAV